MAKHESPEFYILKKDKELAWQRINELEREIQALGPEFHMALTQSNETWHDNAPFDALREKQAVLAAELQMLKEYLAKASVSMPKAKPKRVSIGSYITLKTAKGIQKFLLAGHWSYRTGAVEDGAMVITCQSPLGKALLESEAGETITLPTNNNQFQITAIEDATK
jgi:transcription elongation GreA/GreB family factor